MSVSDLGQVTPNRSICLFQTMRRYSDQLSFPCSRTPTEQAARSTATFSQFLGASSFRTAPTRLCLVHMEILLLRLRSQHYA
jgi:hypothetical protein